MLHCTLSKHSLHSGSKALTILSGFFPYLSYLAHPSLLGLQTKTRRWATFLLSSYSDAITWRRSWAPWWMFLCILSTSTQIIIITCTERGCFGFPGWIPMIQPLFCSSCVAIQWYETGMKFSCWAVPELHTTSKTVISVQLRVFFVSSKSLSSTQWFYSNCWTDESSLS